MGKYIENHLTKNEKIIKKAKISAITIFTSIFRLRFFRNLVAMATTELGFTDKNVIGKSGFISSKAMSSSLDKVQNVSVKSGLFGKIFNYGDVTVTTASGTYKFFNIAKAEAFKTALMTQIETYGEEKVKYQAAQMAQAMAGAIKN